MSKPSARFCGPSREGPMRRIIGRRVAGMDIYRTLDCGHEVYCSYSDSMEYGGKGEMPCSVCAQEAKR